MNGNGLIIGLAWVAKEAVRRCLRKFAASSLKQWKFQPSWILAFLPAFKLARNKSVSIKVFPPSMAIIIPWNSLVGRGWRRRRRISTTWWKTGMLRSEAFGFLSLLILFQNTLNILGEEVWPDWKTKRLSFLKFHLVLDYP